MARHPARCRGRGLSRPAFGHARRVKYAPFSMSKRRDEGRSSATRAGGPVGPASQRVRCRYRNVDGRSYRCARFGAYRCTPNNLSIGSTTVRLPPPAGRIARESTTGESHVRRADRNPACPARGDGPARLRLHQLRSKPRRLAGASSCPQALVSTYGTGVSDGETVASVRRYDEYLRTHLP